MFSANQLDILGFNTVPVNQDVVNTLTKENFESIDEEIKEGCKILKFSSEWKFDEILSTILRLESQNYPNLLIFIIEDKSFGFFWSNDEKLPQKVEILQKNLLKFNKNRSMILQLTSRDENVTKFYYKEDNSEAFHNIKEQTAETGDFHDFPTFLWLYLNDKVENLEDLMLKKLPKAEDSSLVLRFLRTLELSYDFCDYLVRKCAAEGSIVDLLASIDGYIDGEGKLQGCKAEYCISSEFNYTSVLYSAISNSNQEITKFLVEKCANLIQRLPFEHQVDVSTTAYETNQIDVLCDLLEFCDFPFPSDFDPESVTDERLREIDDSRRKLHADVLAENLSGIEGFLRNNLTLKFAYNLDNESAFSYALDSKRFQSFMKITETLSQMLDTETLRQFILGNEIFVSVVCSTMNGKGIEVFIDSVESRTDSNFIREMLKFKDKKGENLLFKLIRSGTTDTQKFKEISHIMEKFLDFNEIVELMTSRKDCECNILHICARSENTRQLTILLTIIKIYLNSLNLLHKFKEIFGQKSLHYDEKFFYIAARWKNKESHQTMWRLLLKTFENREELKDLMMEDNFVHLLVINDKPDIIEFTFMKIKENYSEDQYRELLMSKGNYGRNLLQLAAYGSKNLQTHKLLWKISRDLCKSDAEFLEFLREGDNHNYTVFHLAAAFSASEIAEFMIKEIEKIASREEVRKLLSKLGQGSRNLLQSAAKQNKSIELHQSLWKILREYFNSSEFMDMIKHADADGSNILLNAVKHNRTEIVELTWTKIKTLLLAAGVAELREYLKCISNEGKNIFHMLVERNDEELLKYFYTELESCFVPQNSSQLLKELLSQKTSDDNESVLHLTARCYDNEFKMAFWELVLKTFENHEELKDLMMDKDKYGNISFHLLITDEKADMIKFSLRNIQEIFSNAQCKEIFNSKGYQERNLFQQAACCAKNVKIHQNFWQIIRQYFDSSEILDMIKHVDKNGRNLLSNAAESNTKEVVELTWNEITSTFSSYEDIELINFIKSDKNILHVLIEAGDTEKLEFLWKNIENCYKKQDLLSQFKELVTQKISRCKQNIFLSAALNSDIEFNEALWDLLLDTFEDREGIKNLLAQTDEEDANSPIHKLLNAEKEDMVKFTLKKAKENLSDDQYQQILKSKGFSGRNLLQAAATVSKFVEIHKFLWKTLLDFCKSDAEFLEFLMEVDINGDNVFHLAAAFSTSDIAEFMIKEIEKISSREEVRRLLSKLGQGSLNLFQSAAIFNKSIELHQSLWKILREYFDPSEIVDMIKHIDEYGDNLFQYAVDFNSKEVVELTWNEINGVFRKCNDPELPEYLKYANNFGENILHVLVEANDVEKLGFLWKELEKYFSSKNSSQKFMEVVRQNISETGENILHMSSNCGEIEFHEALWELLLNTFKNRDELKDLILQGDIDGNNFFHLLIITDKPHIIDFTLKIIKEIFGDAQHEEILRSKGNCGRNLLQLAAYGSKNLQTHKLFWKISRDFCKSDEEFLEFLKEVDSQNNTVLHLAACFSTSDILEFLIKEVEKIASREEVRRLLSKLGQFSRNLLQSAVIQNESFELHQSLWKIIRKYFDPSEIVDMIKHIDEYGDNLLFCVVKFNIKEIAELTWDEIKKVLIYDEYFWEHSSELWNECNTHLSNVLEKNSYRKAKENFSKKWKELIHKFQRIDSYKLLKKIQSLQVFPTDFKALHRMTYCDKMEFHEDLWKALLNSFEDKEQLKILLLQKDVNGNNFVHLIVINCKFEEIIEFTFNKIKENFSEDHYQELLRSEGQSERTLLQAAACASKDIKIHQILWKNFQDSFKSDEEFLEILKKVDKNGSNVFHLTVRFATREIFELMIEELEKNCIARGNKRTSNHFML